MKKQKLITILTAFLSLIPSLSFAQEIPFSIHPSYTHNGNKNWIILSLQPNTTFTDYITLTNHSTEPIKLNLNFHEAEDTTEGFKIHENRPHKNLGNWINQPLKSITLPPKETQKIPIQIKIPANANHQQYIGVLLATYENPTEGNPFNIITRIGTRFYIDINPNAEYKTSILESTNDFENKTIIFFSALTLLITIIYIKHQRNQYADK